MHYLHFVGIFVHRAGGLFMQLFGASLSCPCLPMWCTSRSWIFLFPLLVARMFMFFVIRSCVPHVCPGQFRACAGLAPCELTRSASRPSGGVLTAALARRFHILKLLFYVLAFSMTLLASLVEFLGVTAAYQKVCTAAFVFRFRYPVSVAGVRFQCIPGELVPFVFSWAYSAGRCWVRAIGAGLCWALSTPAAGTSPSTSSLPRIRSSLLAWSC